MLRVVTLKILFKIQVPNLGPKFESEQSNRKPSRLNEYTRGYGSWPLSATRHITYSYGEKYGRNTRKRARWWLQYTRPCRDRRGG